jgi:hypothetical protein
VETFVVQAILTRMIDEVWFKTCRLVLTSPSTTIDVYSVRDKPGQNYAEILRIRVIYVDSTKAQISTIIRDK